MENYGRYIVNISFKKFTDTGYKEVQNIVESFKTFREAQQYKTLVDESVSKACVVDRVTLKIVEWWVKD